MHYKTQAIIMGTLLLYRYMEDIATDELSDKLDEAVREAIDDDTFRKVQRVSYSTHGPENVR